MWLTIASGTGRPQPCCERAGPGVLEARREATSEIDLARGKSQCSSPKTAVPCGRATLETIR